jgi:hypothetical protein
MPRPDLLAIFVNQSETVEMDLYYTQFNSCSLGPKDPKNGRKEGRKKERTNFRSRLQHKFQSDPLSLVVQ